MSIVNGIKNCEQITDLLNSIIVDTGQAIATDNKLIWAGLLHQPWVDNLYWGNTIAAMEMLIREVPSNFKSFHREAVYTAARVFDQYQHNHPRCMDTKQAKQATWRLIMSIREVINSINEQVIPNA